MKADPEHRAALETAPPHGSAQQEVMTQIAAACGPQQHLVCWGYSYWSDFACVQWTIDQGAPWGSEPEAGTCCTLRDKLSPQLFEFAHKHGCPCDCEVANCKVVLWDDDQYLPAQPDIVSTEAGYLSPEGC